MFVNFFEFENQTSMNLFFLSMLADFSNLKNPKSDPDSNRYAHLKLFPLFPLYCSWWLTADIVYNPVDSFYIVDDLVGDIR
jgi:hypothetical protein